MERALKKGMRDPAGDPASPDYFPIDDDANLLITWQPVRLEVFERKPTDTDAQWQWFCDERDWQSTFFGVMRALLQLVRTRQGAAATCPMRRCRRQKRCATIRRQQDPFHTLDVVPPCAPYDGETLFALRDEMMPLVKRWCAAREAVKAGRQGAGRPRPGAGAGARPPASPAGPES